MANNEKGATARGSKGLVRVSDESRSASGASEKEPRYTVNPAERVRELLFPEEIPDTAVLTYSFDQGYERLDYQVTPEHGGIHYAGVYHPDGMCDGDHICSFCGSVHTYG